MPGRRSRSRSHSRSQGSSAPVPALGSTGCCQGSNRCEASRFRHKKWETSRNGFVELVDNTMQPEELRSCLEQVRGVSSVQLTHRGDKASQNNPDPYPTSEVFGHMQQQRWEVFLDLFPGTSVEFEVTRSLHTMEGALT